MAPSDATPARDRWQLGRLLLFAACMPILVLLVLPSLIIVPMALTKGDLIQFPPIWISVHSFTDYLGRPCLGCLDGAFLQDLGAGGDDRRAGRHGGRDGHARAALSRAATWCPA